MSTPQESPTRVAIGLIGRGGSYLIRQRLAGQIMEGVWEFPGGKSEIGETPDQTAVRECREEVGLEVEIDRLRAKFDHHYPHAWVELSYYDCRLTDPTVDPDPKSGFIWVPAQELSSYTFPGANEPIIAALVNESLAQTRSCDPAD